jgi:hypothetical protein
MIGYFAFDFAGLGSQQSEVLENLGLDVIKSISPARDLGAINGIAWDPRELPWKAELATTALGQHFRRNGTAKSPTPKIITATAPWDLIVCGGAPFPA